METIYLDHNATTPVHPEVLEVMLPILKGNFGNPSSIHSQGREARVKLDEAREQVASLLHAHPSEIIFTSGGTESDNLALSGVAWANRDKGTHLISSRAEHPAILNPLRELEKRGFQITCVEVDSYGRVDPEAVWEAIQDDTILISLQHANSEVGTLQPIQEVGHLARERGILFHTDAVQTVGKIPFNVEWLPVDLVSISSHKMYGPKGVGALYVKRGLPALNPLIAGGGQEKKRRGGTENVPGIVGLGKAAEIAQQIEDREPERQRGLRESLKESLSRSLTEVEFFGHPEEALPNTLNLAFGGVEGQTLMIRLDLEGISVSTGTACSSGVTLPSETLEAMGVSPETIARTVRLSLGRETSDEKIGRVVETLIRLVGEIRNKEGVCP